MEEAKPAPDTPSKSAAVATHTKTSKISGLFEKVLLSRTGTTVDYFPLFKAAILGLVDSAVFDVWDVGLVVG